MSRLLQVTRAGWGLASLVAPDLVIGRVYRSAPDAPTRAAVRVLGVRHLVQAVVSGPDPSPEVRTLGVAVDVLHAASLLPLVAVPRYRRPGLTDAAIASALALVSWRVGAQARRDDQRWQTSLARAVLSMSR